MSDIDPELPEWLTEAILDTGPPADAVDLVKNAFSWRTVEADLMELAYDSVLDEAGVRDASARRTMEFTAAGISLIVEVDGLTVRGTVVGEVESLSWSVGVADAQPIQLSSGQFAVTAQSSGTVVLIAATSAGTFESSAFTVG